MIAWWYFAFALLAPSDAEAAMLQRLCVRALRVLTIAEDQCCCVSGGGAFEAELVGQATHVAVSCMAHTFVFGHRHRLYRPIGYAGP